jgi:hypothetical protein
MRGTIRKISLRRRLIVDLMHASRGVPFVSLKRDLDISQLLAARAAAPRPPGWAAIFVKAFALVARDEPVLRTLYAKWPWPHFYELPCSIGMVLIARIEDDEACALPEKVTAPDTMALSEIDAQIRRAKEAPVGQIPSFRKALLAASLPLPIRRFAWWIGLNFGRQRANNIGSFGVTSVAAYGGGELHAIGPGPFIVSYGLVTPDQTIDVVIRWDHRITDAVPIAKALTRLEQVLNTEISRELSADHAPGRPRPARAVAT